MTDKVTIIAGPPSSGKTTDLIKLAAKRGGYIVCSSSDESNRIREQAKAMGLTIRIPITYRDALGPRGELWSTLEYYIDDLLRFALSTVYHWNIVAATFETHEGERS